jgi:hypothetical protein
LVYHLQAQGVSAFLAALLKPLAALLAAWFGGKAAGRDAAKIEELQGYAETSKRIDAIGPMPDPDAAAEWLRQRAKQRGNL